MDERWRSGTRDRERLADTGATWTAFYVASGVSGSQRSPGSGRGGRSARRDKLLRHQPGAGWSPDSIDRMLRGEDPIVVTSAADHRTPQLALERPRKALSAGCRRRRGLEVEYVEMSGQSS